MRYLAFIILVMLSCSCRSKDDHAIKTIDVQSSTGPEIKNLSEIATDIQYIPLETHPDALLRSIGYLKEGNEKFYMSTALEILCFDKSGKFLYKLDQQGRGPNEYIYLSDYDIRPEKNQMVVLTRDKLYFYNETDTGFLLLKQLDLKMQPRYSDFFPGQENILLSFSAASGLDKYQSVLINPEGDTLFNRPNFYRFTRNSKVVMSFSADNIIMNTDGILKIKGFLNDTIFTISSDYKFIPYMILNTGGNNITNDFLANIPMPDMNERISPIARFLQISEVLEVERYLFYRYSFQQTMNWGVYDKKTDLSHLIDGKSLLIDDISGGVNIEPKFALNGLIYSWTDALSFKNHLSGEEFDKSEVKNSDRKSELEKLAALVKEDDNHLLIVITPKK